jgi:hypothetical protein
MSHISVETTYIVEVCLYDSTTRPLVTISIAGWIRVYQSSDFSWDCVSLNGNLIISLLLIVDGVVVG